MEYVIWGIPPNQTDEQPLFTRARNQAEAERVLIVLREKHGCTKLRIQVIDLSADLADQWRKATHPK